MSFTGKIRKEKNESRNVAWVCKTKTKKITSQHEKKALIV